MTYYDLKDFKGLYTSADSDSTPGSPDCENVLIDTGNIEKVKGYTRITGSTIAVSVITSSTDTVLTCSNTVASNASLVIYNNSDNTYAAVLEKKIWKVKSRTDTSIVIDGADTSALLGKLETTLAANTEFNERISSTLITNQTADFDVATASTTYTTSGVYYDYPYTINNRGILMGETSYIVNSSQLKTSYLICDISAIQLDKIAIHSWVYNKQTIAAIVEPLFGTIIPGFFNGGAGSAFVPYFKINKFGTIEIADGTLTNIFGVVQPNIYATTGLNKNIGLYHYCFLFDCTAGLTGSKNIRVFENNTELTVTYSTGSAATTWTPYFASSAGLYTYSQHAQDDFSIIDSSAIIAAGFTEASIVAQLYNNTFDNKYKFVYEYDTELTCNLDLSAQYLQGFSTTGGIALE